MKSAFGRIHPSRWMKSLCDEVRLRRGGRFHFTRGLPSDFITAGDFIFTRPLYFHLALCYNIPKEVFKGKVMESIIRNITHSDKEAVLEMMRVFYASAAVYTNGSEEIFLRDIETAIGNSPFLEGYVFECGGEIAGYSMLAKSFSTEFGKPCVWIEDLYIKEKYRSQGIGKAFFVFIEEKHPDAVFRLEVEEENEGAVRLYKKCGFTVLPYMEMKK